jgi:uncharacterized membrane protein
VTGVILVALTDWARLKESWLAISVGLYVLLTVLAITTYAPAHRRQSALAERAAVGETVETAYAEASANARRWGVAVTLLTVSIVVLMVWKPVWW